MFERNVKAAMIPLFFLVCSCLVLGSANLAYADAVSGQLLTHRQPDESVVEVKVFGDEFYRVTESLDGYTLTVDPETGWLTYAELSRDGSRFLPTEHRYMRAGRGYSTPPGHLRKHLRMSPEAVSQEVRTNKRILDSERYSDDFRGFEASSGPMTAKAVVGGFNALTILVDFSDDTATIPKANLEDHLNGLGYTGYGNNGSVREYYDDVSGGQVDFESEVTDYVRASRTKAWYNNDWLVVMRYRAKVLVNDVLTQLDDAGYDFTNLTASADGTIQSVNIYYAGSRPGNNSGGLWPHAGSLLWAFNTHDGMKIKRYQMTDITSSPYIRTFCHENGHMLFGWPDFYDYDSRGVGHYCLMGYGGNSYDPVPPSAFPRMTAGWATPTEIAFGSTGWQTLASNGLDSLIYYNPSDPDEYFLFESRTNSGNRNAHLPDEGLLIWHVDEDGDRDAQDMTCGNHYVLSLEQGDGDFDLENYNNLGDSWDLFDASQYDEFGPSTTPDSDWWCDGSSSLDITNISAAGSSMSFHLN